MVEECNVLCRRKDETDGAERAARVVGVNKQPLGPSRIPPCHSPFPARDAAPDFSCCIRFPPLILWTSGGPQRSASPRIPS